MPRVRSFAAMLLLLIAVDASAARTDVVVLRNGDHVTGEVKQMTRGQLKLSTDDVGTIYVEWDKVVSLTTALRYEVATQDGARHVGVIAPDGAGFMRVVAEDGTSMRFGMMDIVSLDPIRRGWVERIDGTLDVGGSYTKSSGVSQLSVDLDAAYRRPAYKLFTLFESTLTRQNNADRTSRFALQSGYTHFRRDRWIVTPFVYIERNPDLGLTLRSLAAFTAGRYIEQTPRRETMLAGGVAAGRERPTQGDSIPNLDLVGALSTSFFRYDYPRTSVDLTLLAFPELNHRGRVRANANARLRRELFRDFIAAVTVYDTFDSRPQVADVDRNDIGVTLSIGWTF